MSSVKLQKIDTSLMSEHPHLEPSDYCYFFGEYAGRQGFSHSPMNQLIHNSKKPVSRKNLLEWRYKEEAIEKVAELLLHTSNWHKLKNYTWVPIPPSQLKLDEDYDDRLLRILQKVRETEEFLDVREILLARQRRHGAHTAKSTKRTVYEHLSNMVIDESKKAPIPRAIVIFDDVLTTGSQYKASKKLLTSIFPTMPTVGIFIARSKIIEHDLITLEG